MTSRYIPLGPFTYTAPGDLGAHRDEMLCNPMLLRDKVGQTNVRGFYIPGKGFTYGMPYEKREYTAADALRGWSGCFKQEERKQKKKIQGRDFISLNRAAVSAGLVTAKENYDYRTTHDIRLKPIHVLNSGAKKFPADMVFGRPARPSTPMFDLLEHKYQDKWIQQQYNQHMTKRDNETKDGVSAYRQAICSALHQSSPSQEDASQWMPQILRIMPVCWRGPDVRAGWCVSTLASHTHFATSLGPLPKRENSDECLKLYHDPNVLAKSRTRKNKMMQYDTRATLLRTYQVPVDQPPLWQMPRFRNDATPHLQTFRSAADKENAVKHSDFDHVSRKGVFGQGVYESAKN